MNQSIDPSRPPYLPPRRWRLRPILLALVIFVCGTLVGAGLTSHYLWLNIADRPPVIPGIAARVSRHMVDELELNQTQAEQIGRIFENWESQTREIHMETQERFESIFSLMRSDIANVLTPEQMREWDHRTERMMKRWREEGKRRFQGDHHPGDGSPRNWGPPGDHRNGRFDQRPPGPPPPGASPPSDSLPEVPKPSAEDDASGR